jgi:threonine dehydratase
MHRFLCTQRIKSSYFTTKCLHQCKLALGLTRPGIARAATTTNAASSTVAVTVSASSGATREVAPGRTYTSLVVAKKSKQTPSQSVPSFVVKCKSNLHMQTPQLPLSAEELQAAYGRVKPHVHRTPVHTSSNIFAELESLHECNKAQSMHFKCEVYQRTGAFKYRGAINAVLDLSGESAARGVVTHSSGNHAAALALAAQKRGIPAFIVMPTSAPANKKRAVASYGAKIIFCQPTLESREQTAAQVQRETGATFVHPYNDAAVIAGQSSLCQEILEQMHGSINEAYRHVDVLLMPIGGGGLISGTALAKHYFSPQTQLIGVEPKGADDARRSVLKGSIIPMLNPQTIADGLRTSLGDKTFPIIEQHVDNIVAVDEHSIVHAMRLIWERMKIIVEPSSAVPLAALLEGKVDIAGKNVVVPLCGGNVDLDALPWV